MTLALLAVLGVLCIVAVNTLAPKVGVSAPLALVAIGIVVSVFRLVPPVNVPPEWILAGILPPLLYSAAAAMPTMDFRRDFRAISGLSVTLVVLTSFALGWFFSAMLPGLGLAGGVALGAIISPTDAVATSIVKRLRVAPRAVAVLDGESLLNDASALVLLRSAIAATAGAVSHWHAVGAFVRSIVLATLIGVAVGYAVLLVRRYIAQPAVNTLLSFTVPFIAYQPTEHLHASGLVAVVVAGISIGHGSPRYLSAVHRHNDEQNWRTIELLLEGAAFLVMGLQVLAIVDDVLDAHGSLRPAVGLAVVALAITLTVRGLFVGPLLLGLRRLQRRYAAARPAYERMQARLDEATEEQRASRKHGFMRLHLQRLVADADFLAAKPMGWRDGVLLVWAGMRGAVTVAAAQTLPYDMPYRSLLVLIAFLVATLSLALQGGSMPALVRRLAFPPPDRTAAARERETLASAVEQAALVVLEDAALCKEDGTVYGPELVSMVRERLIDSLHDPEHELQWREARELTDRLLEAQRKRLLDIRIEGTCSSEALQEALARIDAVQISMKHGHHS